MLQLSLARTLKIKFEINCLVISKLVLHSTISVLLGLGTGIKEEEKDREYTGSEER